MPSKEKQESEPFWTGPGYRGEYQCPHGVGHGNHIHGCDGCCDRADFPLSKANIEATRNCERRKEEKKWEKVTTRDRRACQRRNMMPTSRQSSGKKSSTFGKTLPEFMQLTKRIERTVDSLMKCSKSQVDNHIERLRKLWRERGALVAATGRSSKTPTGRGESCVKTANQTGINQEPENVQEKCEGGRADNEAAASGEPATDESSGGGGIRGSNHSRCRETGSGRGTQEGQGHDAEPDRPGGGSGVHSD